MPRNTLVIVWNKYMPQPRRCLYRKIKTQKKAAAIVSKLNKANIQSAEWFNDEMKATVIHKPSLI